MTKTKALKQLTEYARYVLNPSFAREIAKAFGYTLKDLGLQPQKTKTFDRLNYSPLDANFQAVACFKLAELLALKVTGTQVTTNMNGRGSAAEDITEKSVALLQTS